MTGEPPITTLDPLVHAPVRLAVLSILASTEDADFVFLRETTGTSDGNLSAHLRKLEEAGYVTVNKGFKGRRPHTTCAMTRAGRAAFTDYLDKLEQFIRQQRGGEEE